MPEAGAPPRSRHFLSQHFRHEWRATLFVAAFVTVLHLGTSWLEAFESYAFLGISNNVSKASAQTVPSAIVVRIDQETFESRYQDRTPLDRCVLAQQLAAIYAAKPEIVVVDLDLSPALWITGALRTGSVGEAQCEQDLYQLIRLAAAHTKTILICPFPAADAHVAANEQKQRWRHNLVADTHEQVRFGHAALPVRYGVTNEYFVDPESIYAVAHAAGDVTRRPRCVSCEQSDHTLPKEKIEPRAWAKLRWMLTSVASDREITANLETLLQTSGDASKPVVFFGAGYSGDDLFLTALGEFYGVEIHAAAFASQSRWSWLSHLVGFVSDLIFAFIFGLLIAWYWKRYFTWRTAAAPDYAEAARIWLIALTVSLAVVLLMMTLFSRYVLLRWGVWLSPVPIAIGMLIEAFVSGSVTQANSRLKLLERPAAPLPVTSCRALNPKRLARVLTPLSWGVWGLTVAGALWLIFTH